MLSADGKRYNTDVATTEQRRQRVLKDDEISRIADSIEYNRRECNKIVEYNRRNPCEIVDYTRQLFFLIVK